jgi:hypothetical protein
LADDRRGKSDVRIVRDHRIQGEGDESIVCLGRARTQAPGPMPTVPEAKDDVKMEVPPIDLPTSETSPKAG